jgi:hypothetical protein
MEHRSDPWEGRWHDARATFAVCCLLRITFWSSRCNLGHTRGGAEYISTHGIITYYVVRSFGSLLNSTEYYGIVKNMRLILDDQVLCRGLTVVHASSICIVDTFSS